jgi:hypothetical protein
MESEPREPNSESQAAGDELTARQQRCRELDQRVKAALRAGRAAMWMTAEALYAFDAQAGWSALGYSTRGDWLADPEVRITERSYQRLVRVWREAVIRRRVDPPALARLDVSKVEIVLAAIEVGSAKLPDALADAEALGWRELRQKYARPPLQRPRTSEDPPPEPDKPRLPDTPSGASPARLGEGAARPAHEPADPDVAPDKRKKDETERQLAQWLAFYNEVRQAAATGQPLPRVAAQVIVPGLDALAHLLEAAGVRGIDRLMP